MTITSRAPKTGIDWSFDFPTKQFIVFNLLRPDREEFVTLVRKYFDIEIPKIQNVWFAKNSEYTNYMMGYRGMTILTKEQALLLPQIGPVPIIEAYKST